MTPRHGFADWFRTALTKRGISAGEFAKSANISRSAAYFYRSGERLPTRGVVTRIARTLGVASGDLPSFIYGKPGRPRSAQQR
jgi:transcriptional regulator with XRE-family HTH domain